MAETSLATKANHKKSKNQLRREKAKLKKLSKANAVELGESVESVEGSVDRSELQSQAPIEGSVEKLEVQSEAAVEHVDQSEVKDENSYENQTENVENQSRLLSGLVQNTDSGKLFESELDITLKDPAYAEFRSVFSKFQTVEQTVEKAGGDIFYSDDEDLEDSGSEASDSSSEQISKKKQRKMHKIPLSTLKAVAPKPELVEWFDADSTDPVLLVEIKASPGVVPVPDHWLLKRDYLSMKKGTRKILFELPDYIKATGIMEMRDAKQDDEQTLRQKTRERVQPKMGRLDIDYQKLHDAFFKFQTKPKLYKIGEVYYEGKEFEQDYSRFRAGRLSASLKEALNIPPLAPPPWLLNMQRYGPPPSYPALRIPGLNAPIPPGAQWGFQPGGYGRPPLDDKGTPLYGDVYGVVQTDNRIVRGAPIEKEPWGDLLPEESESEEDEAEDEEENEQENDEGQGYVDEEAALAAEKEAQSKLEAASSASTGQSTNEYLELRKNRTTDGRPKALYQVLEERSSAGDSGFMGTQRGYDIPVLGEDRARPSTDDVEVSIDPDSLANEGLNQEELNRQYQEQQNAPQPNNLDYNSFQEDLSDLIASESRKRQRQEEERQERRRKR